MYLTNYKILLYTGVLHFLIVYSTRPTDVTDVTDMVCTEFSEIENRTREDPLTRTYSAVGLSVCR